MWYGRLLEWWWSIKGKLSNDHFVYHHNTNSAILVFKENIKDVSTNNTHAGVVRCYLVKHRITHMQFLGVVEEFTAYRFVCSPSADMSERMKHATSEPVIIPYFRGGSQNKSRRARILFALYCSEIVNRLKSLP